MVACFDAYNWAILNFEGIFVKIPGTKMLMVLLCTAGLMVHQVSV